MIVIERENSQNVFFVEKGSVRIFRTNEFGKELTTRIVKKDEKYHIFDLKGKFYGRAPLKI